MSINYQSSNDPIISFNLNSVKNDILLLKNDAVKEFEEIQKSLSNKYNEFDKTTKNKLQLHEEHLNSLEFKIEKLSELINNNKFIEKKVYDLSNFKEKIEDLFFKERIKIYNLAKDLNTNITRIDKILSDSVIYPGIIGKACKHKTFHDLIDYILTQISLNSIFREKNVLDFKSYKTKIENLIKIFNSQSSKLLEASNEFSRNCIKNSEKEMKIIIASLEDKIFKLKTEIMKYKINLEKFFPLFEKTNDFYEFYKLNKNKRQRISFENNINLFYDKIKKIKLSKRNSDGKLKNYITGRISIDNLYNLLKRKSNLYEKENKEEHINYNYLNKRESIDEYNKKYKKNNSFFKFGNNKTNINLPRKSMVSQNNMRKILMQNKNTISNYSDSMKFNSNIICDCIKKQELKEKKKRFSNEIIKGVINRKIARDNSDEVFFKIDNSKTNVNLPRKSMVSQNNIRKILMENENKFSNYSDNMKLNDNIIINDIKKQELKENKKRFSNETIKGIVNRKTVRDNSDEIINTIYQKSKSITNLNSTEISSIVSKSKIKQNPKIKFQKSFNSFKYESNPDKFKLIKNNILHYATVMKYKYSHSTKKKY